MRHGLHGTNFLYGFSSSGQDFFKMPVYAFIFKRAAYSLDFRGVLELFTTRNGFLLVFMRMYSFLQADRILLDFRGFPVPFSMRNGTHTCHGLAVARISQAEWILSQFGEISQFPPSFPGRS
jgi:hypothetical protein